MCSGTPTEAHFVVVSCVSAVYLLPVPVHRRLIPIRIQTLLIFCIMLKVRLFSPLKKFYNNCTYFVHKFQIERDMLLYCVYKVLPSAWQRVETLTCGI
jgi:hypothetical protein